MRRLLAGSILLSLAFPIPAQIRAATIDVPADQPTIQAGVDAASPGDTVQVSSGFYYEHDIVIDSDIVLMSEPGPPGSVNIDAQGLGRGIRCTSVGPNGVIIGFTVRNAVSHGAWPAGNGAGLYLDSSSPAIRGCIFRDNVADDFGLGGGALAINGSSPTFEDCQFISNHAEEDGGGFVASLSSSAVFLRCEFRGNTAGDVGALKSEVHSTVELRECRFIENEATQSVAGVRCGGGTSMTIVDCVFAGNDGENVGALGIDADTDVTVENCLFVDNRSPRQAGAVRVVLSNAVFRNCVFIRNLGGSPGTVAPGGAFLADRGDVQIANCTFVGNSAGLGGCAYVRVGTNIEIASSILYSTEGTRAIDCEPGAQVTVTCSDFFGNKMGDGLDCVVTPESIFFEDPQFCDFANDDVTLSSTSPCLPANNACGTLIGALGQGCGSVSVTETSWGRIKSLYR